MPAMAQMIQCGEGKPQIVVVWPVNRVLFDFAVSRVPTYHTMKAVGLILIDN
jgi:hypothetical protein